MKKILLITLGLSVFIWADMKTPYTIQDESSDMSSGIDSELLPMEKALTAPQEDALQEIKDHYRIQDEPLEKPKNLEQKHIEKMKAPSKSTKAIDQENEIDRIRRELNIQAPKLSKREIKVKKMREEFNIQEPSAKVKKLDKIRDELNIDYQVPKYESSFDKRMNDVKEKLGFEDGLDIDSALSSIKQTLHLEDKPKKDEGFSLTNSLSSFGDTIGMDLEIPSFFGSSSKKKESGVLDSVLGFGMLGDIKDTGTSLYQGAKYSGQSAEMMSGMMYNSSKMYNTMFGVFDDSPFNVFEEEEEASLFDVFEHGNSVMDMFD
ncbi:MAG: hypothetical protein HKP62_02120 [Sulfurovum sp.]|nr:hypothetical protein [Sulfurovum sp.]NNJ44789.1 hypothetical protein [Sulfurovum sp.]